LADIHLEASSSWFSGVFELGPSGLMPSMVSNLTPVALATRPAPAELFDDMGAVAFLFALLAEELGVPDALSA
jgi:hypothetical protein